jgi:hypothetical protein
VCPIAIAALKQDRERDVFTDRNVSKGLLHQAISKPVIPIMELNDVAIS